MQSTLVRIKTSDGVELQGLNFKGSGRAAHAVVMHLHGTWGNFYGNPFIDHFSDFYPRRGFSFLTGNNRGHDEGSIGERFVDSTKDIQAWLEFAASQRYRWIILQGHSLGALKAVYYLQIHATPRSPIKGLILLSPFDVVAFYGSGDMSVREKRLQQVRAIAASNMEALVPKDLFNIWLISAGAYLDLADSNTRADIFPFRTGSLKNSILSRLKIPTFAAIGGDDFAAYPSPKAELEQLSELQHVRAALVKGAPHNFADRESALLKELSPWLPSVAPR